MKTVKQMCLGVAVAGIVAGAGSAISTAVASADPAAPDSTQSADATDAGSSAPVGSRAEARDSSARSRAATSTVEPATTSVETANNDRPRASVQQRAPRTAATAIRAPRTVKVAVESVSAPSSAASVTAPEGIAPPQPVEQVAAAAAVVAAPVAFAAVPALPAPAPVPLLPLLPFPAPPVAPANAVTVSSASSTTTRRGANAVAAVQIAPPTRVLLIGTDGTNLDKVLADPANVGFFDLMAESVTGATSIVGHTTISGPSWTTILTGVWDNKSGVINNIFNPAPYDAWPTVFNLVEAHNPEIDTAVIADWKYINDIGAAGAFPVAADDNIFVPFDTSWEGTDDDVTTATIARINATQAADSSFIFSYQVAVDEAGHAYGGGSPEYAAAIRNTSKNIAAIMAAVDAWETLNPGEEWTVIVTTDHGHQQSVGFGHGFQSPNETSSFVIFDLEGDGANDGKQNLGYSNADITPTIVNLFGAPPRSDFDGVSLVTNKTDSIVTPVDLKQALNDAVAMYGYPNIGTDIALGVRTVFASVPYFLGIITNTITAQLQAIVDADIFLISPLVGLAEFVVQVTGDILVGVTQAVARVVATLTGSGVIPPTDDPLPPPPADSVFVPVLLPAAVLV
ncbi:MAG: alkaline phosphatase family protein [Mycobacterium sp.]|nr:alkaline phosphatase family protein [Mycobacterium sp.]